jgi:uncharacterized protein YjiS (DUF1127 family)
METVMTAMINTHAWNAQERLRFGSLLTGVLALPWTWARRLQQRRQLIGLLGQSEHVLKDVGLQRDVITREGLKPFWSA